MSSDVMAVVRKWYLCGWFQTTMLLNKDLIIQGRNSYADFCLSNLLKSEYMLYMCLCFGTYILWLHSAYLMSYKAENCDAFYRHGIEIWVYIFQKPCPSSIPTVMPAYGHGGKCNSYRCLF